MKEDEPQALAADAFKASFPEASKAREAEDLSGADSVEDRLYRLMRNAIETGAISLGRAAEIPPPPTAGDAHPCRSVGGVRSG